MIQNHDAKLRHAAPMLRRRKLNGEVTVTAANGFVSTVYWDEYYPYSYTCEQQGVTDRVRKTQIFFDFEFVLPHPEEPMEEVIWQDFPEVEFAILRRMAAVTGLLTCNLNKQVKQPAGLVRSEEPTESLVQSKDNLIVGLSSWYPDKFDIVGELQPLDDKDLFFLCHLVTKHLTLFFIVCNRKLRIHQRR